MTIWDFLIRELIVHLLIGSTVLFIASAAMYYAADRMFYRIHLNSILNALSSFFLGLCVMIAIVAMFFSFAAGLGWLLTSLVFIAVSFTLLVKKGKF